MTRIFPAAVVVALRPEAFTLYGGGLRSGAAPR
jgi:hypothetical protein